MSTLLGGGYFQELDRDKRRQFRLQSIPYVLVDGVLVMKDLNGVLLRCINSNQTDRVMKEFHDGLDGGHFSARTTCYKDNETSYYWPNLFSDSHKYVRKFEKCVFFLGK